jgi:DNA-binding CsgD family transcriptional regulator
LQRLIGAALDCSISSNGNTRQIMVVPRPSQKRDLLVEILACAGRYKRQPPNVPVVFLLVTDPAAGSIDPDLLRTFYGLTQREAQLAAILHDGCDLPHAAIELGIAYNTARVHLGNVLKKTGCSSRPELVALLTRIQISFDGN